MSMRFSRDGHYLVLSGGEQTSWIDVSPRDWLDEACALTEGRPDADDAIAVPGSVTTSEVCA